MDKTNVKVEFSLYGENFDPSSITKLLDINPTRYWNKGDHIKKDIYKKETCWELSTDYEESLDINIQIEAIVVQIKSKKEIIQNLMKNYNLECKLEVVIRIENNEKPAMYLEKELIRFLSDIEAMVDFDLYIYS